MFCENQYGFRPKHSTVNAVTEFVYKTLSSLDNDKSTLATFLDLSKAFDTIDHTIMLDKLSYYGIRGVALQWFRSYLTNRKQYVSVLGVTSDTMQVNCEVKL